MTPIKWIQKEVQLSSIAPTPNNYKIKNMLGRERLQASLKSFGLASSITCNYAGKFGDITKLIIIDGNSRHEEAVKLGAKKIWVALPSRILTVTEFREMSAIFDLAKSGDVDMERIHADLGTTKNFYEKYSMETPAALLNKMGNKTPHKSEPITKKETKVKVTAAPDELSITLYYNKKQEAEFRQIEERLKKKFRTTSTSDTILKALRTIK